VGDAVCKLRYVDLLVHLGIRPVVA
jgi:hypothetical protein